jgi:hypothetical protein
MGKLIAPTNSNTGDFPILRAGSHLAVCDLIAYLGLQEGSGAFPRARHQVYIRFEVPSQRCRWEKDGRNYDQPAIIGIYCTFSMHSKANLRHHLESWRGRQFTEQEAANFDIAGILGKPCMLSIMQRTASNGKTYADIVGIAAIPRELGARPIIAEMPTVLYAPDSTETYAQLPKFLQEKIDNQILETPSAAPAGAAGRADADDGADFSYYDGLAQSTEISDDDIPF